MECMLISHNKDGRAVPWWHHVIDKSTYHRAVSVMSVIPSFDKCAQCNGTRCLSRAALLSTISVVNDNNDSLYAIQPVMMVMEEEWAENELIVLTRVRLNCGLPIQHSMISEVAWSPVF